MKKKISAILLVTTMVSMTGCVEKIELDAEQESKFIGYSVYSVLEHDKNYMVGLSSAEPETETSNVAAEVETTGQQSTDNTDNQINQGSISENGSDTAEDMNAALNITGATVKYTGMTVCDSFPEDNGEPAFVIKALSGKKLVVLKFDVTNTTDSDIAVDIASKNLSFKGVFSQAIKTSALVTLLPEALNTFDGKIKAGATTQMVLVYEMSDGYVNNLSTITVEVKSESGTKSIKIK